MTRDQLLAWLDTRRPVPPDAVRERLRRAVHDDSGDLAEHLAKIGRELLARVSAHPEAGRELALDLLAADAFVTYAFEAQAETDVSQLARLAEHAGSAA
jgi:hypothetical protein